MLFIHRIPSTGQRMGQNTRRHVATLFARLKAAVRRRSAAFWLDPRTRHLSAATDHADLERRIRAYDEHTRSSAARDLSM